MLEDDDDDKQKEPDVDGDESGEAVEEDTCQEKEGDKGEEAKEGD